MSQTYLNGPSRGCAISAEEFAAQTGCQCHDAAQAAPPTGCGCGGIDPGCPGDGCGQGSECCQQMICCCRPAPAPAPQPPQVEEGCCCKQSFRAALGLLCNQEISSLLDFDAAAFLTNTYSAGAALTCGKRSDQGPRAGAEAESGDRHRPSCPSCSGGASDNLGSLSGSFRRFAPCT